MIWPMKTKGQDEKSLRIFEEKKTKREKSKQRGNCTDHTYYLLGFHARKKLYNQLFYAHCQTTITPTKKLNIKGLKTQ